MAFLEARSSSHDGPEHRTLTVPGCARPLKEALLAIAKLLSDGPVVVVPLVLACLWILGRPEGRPPHLAAVRKLIFHAASRGLSPLEFANCIAPLSISQHLYHPELPSPDLIIRTSGEIRILGFMLWRSVHSELYFADVNWPEFRRVDLLRAIRTYQGRIRRYGR